MFYNYYGSKAAQREYYYSTYSSHPLASYFASEYRDYSEAEYHLLNYITNHPSFAKRLWQNIIAFFKTDEKKSMEDYFSKAFDLQDLERRMFIWHNSKKENRLLI